MSNRSSPTLSSLSAQARPWGITALSVFFSFGTLMSALAAMSLLLPGSMLDPIWHLNPHARTSFATLGYWAPSLLALVCVACALTAYGLFFGRRWGYRLAIGMLLINLIGDIVNVVLEIEPRAWMGIPIVLLLLAYLGSKTVRNYFFVRRP